MKTAEELYQEMTEVFARQTGMEAVAGEAAVRMYALAAQVYGLYAELDWTRKQCFPQTATGEALDKHGFLRGLTRQAATKAEGKLRFSVQVAAGEDLSIPKGTVGLTAGQVAFETVEEVVLSAGSLSVDVLAQAVEAGPSGNTAAGLIRTMSVAPAGIAACTNPAAFTGGREEEEDEAFRARILATYRQLPNGTNAAAYAQQTLAVEGVCAVNVLPKKRGLGTVDVVITSAGGVPGTALVEQVQGVLEEQREIAVDVNVMAPETVTVDLILSVKPKEGLLPGPVIDRVKAALRAWFDGSLLGQDVLLAQIGQKIFAVDGVANYQIQGPVNDVTVGRMAEEAREEGFHRIADLFAAVGEIEKSHYERYLKLLENLENDEVFKKSSVKVWYCRNCGHLEYGDKAPDVCPVCNHPQSFFEVKADNY